MPQSRSSILRVVTAAAIAFAGSVSLWSPAAAECMSPLPPPTVAGYLGVGFEAVVRTVSHRPSVHMPGAADYDWGAKLRVTDVIRGEVPRRLVLAGWSYRVTCDNFHGEFLHPGDRLLVTTDGLTEHSLGQNVLAWRLGPQGWHFGNRVVHSHDAANRFIPHAARAATTRAEILALIKGGLPDTATALSVRAPASAFALPVWATPVVLVVAALWRRRLGTQTVRERRPIVA
jgi:hypothetical protein